MNIRPSSVIHCDHRIHLDHDLYQDQFFLTSALVLSHMVFFNIGLEYYKYRESLVHMHTPSVL